MSEKEHASFSGRFGSLSLDSPSSTSDSEAESVTYTFINNRTQLEKLTAQFDALVTKPNPWQKPHVYLSAHGRGLGYINGRLGLVQIGIKEDIYLLDVLTYAKCLDVLKEILENKEVEKIIWEGRWIGSEFWHGCQIDMNDVVDLQLADIYEKGITTRNFVPIDALEMGFVQLDEKTRMETTIDLKRLTKLSEEILQREKTDQDYWLRRPLKITLLDHAAFQIIQLRTLHTHLLPSLAKYPQLTGDSHRYSHLYYDARPPANAWYLVHQILPQEVLERDNEVRARYDLLGTRVCAGCRRELHQDSFRDSFARRWTLRLGEHGRMCYTCGEARQTRETRQPIQPTRWLQK